MPLWNSDRINVSHWDYKAPKKLSNGSWTSFIDDAPGSRKTPECQLDECLAKFGVSDPPEQNPDSNRRNLDLSVTSKEMAAFIDTIDDANCVAASQHAETSFGKRYSPEMLKEALYTSMLKRSQYDPLLRTKIVLSGNRRTKIYVVTGRDPESGEDLYDENGTIDDITKNSRVVPIVQFSAMWFANKNCGMAVAREKDHCLASWSRDDETEFENLPCASEQSILTTSPHLTAQRAWLPGRQVSRVHRVRVQSHGWK